jgi:AGZA family xanthine/uracil permease-like MFS transporter
MESGTPTILKLGPLSDGWIPNSASMALLGLVLTAAFLAWRTPGAILAGIVAISIAGLVVPVGEAGGATLTPHPEALAALPASLSPLFLKADLLYPLKNWEVAVVPVVTLMFVDMFDSIGTLVGVSRRANLADESGNLPKMGRALSVDAAATAAGALLGTSPVTAYVESAAGVEAGGRTGFTGVVVAACFLLALFFHPLILCIPAAATTPALVIVGVFMLSGLKGFDWSDIRTTVPAVSTMILIPLGFGIANGIAVGCILHVAIRLITGDFRSVHWLMVVLAVLFLLKFVWVGS